MVAACDDPKAAANTGTQEQVLLHIVWLHHREDDDPVFAWKGLETAGDTIIGIHKQCDWNNLVTAHHARHHPHQARY